MESSPSRQTFPREGRVCFQRSDQAVSESLESHGVLPEFPALQAVKKDREHIAVTDAQRRERGSFLRPGVSSSRITVLSSLAASKITTCAACRRQMAKMSSVPKRGFRV